MKKVKARSKSQFESQSKMDLRPATLEEIVRLTGKDPLVAFAEAACGKLECTACNGAGYMQPGDKQPCKRCHGTKREKTPAALLNALYKLATFFYAPRKAVEKNVAEGDPPEHFVVVKFAGPDGDQEAERE